MGSVSGMAVAHPLLEGRSRRETLLSEGVDGPMVSSPGEIIALLIVMVEAQRLEAPVPVGIDDALAAKVEPLVSGLGGIVYAEPGIHAWLAETEIEVPDREFPPRGEGEDSLHRPGVAVRGRLVEEVVPDLDARLPAVRPDGQPPLPPLAVKDAGHLQIRERLRADGLPGEVAPSFGQVLAPVCLTVPGLETKNLSVNNT